VTRWPLEKRRCLYSQRKYFIYIVSDSIRFSDSLATYDANIFTARRNAVRCISYGISVCPSVCPSRAGVVSKRINAFTGG